jgi:hypothetical protein
MFVLPDGLRHNYITMRWMAYRNDIVMRRDDMGTCGNDMKYISDEVKLKSM